MDDSLVSVEEGEVVTVCVKLADVPPSLLQREIVLEGYTSPGTAESLHIHNQTMHSAYHVTLIEGSDFEAVSWSITFSSSTLEIQCVEIVIADDDIPELTETFSVTIMPVIQPDPQVSIQPSTVNIEIENDDG